jgi:glycosyltransferase involved in cell wall biosynthesis
VARVSLVVSSYNQPNALALAFEGVLGQTRAPDELLVADDGSEADTRALVLAFAQRAPFPVRFETQEDRGFRKSRALNNALRAASGEVFLFLDGDCVPPPGWAAHHLDALAGGADFSTAGYVLLDLEQTRSLTREEIAAGEIDARCGPEQRRRFRAIHRREQLYRLLRRPRKPKIRGGNWAVTRAALFAVNGFDERFDGFGKEDSDVRNRLRNAGFRGVSLWDRAWVFHCDHALDERRTRPDVVRSEPDRSYYDSRLSATTCEHGLVRPGR